MYLTRTNNNNERNIHKTFQGVTRPVLPFFLEAGLCGDPKGSIAWLIATFSLLASCDAATI